MPVTRIITDLVEAQTTVLKRKPLGSEEMPRAGGGAHSGGFWRRIDSQ